MFQTRGSEFSFIKKAEQKIEIKMEKKYKVDEKGFYGQFGGAYVPEILYKCVTDLQKAYLPIIESKEFQDCLLYTSPSPRD